MSELSKSFIKTVDLSACYKCSKQNVLTNVSLLIETGCVTGVCGLNGCGKSTLLSILAGIPSPELLVQNEAEIGIADDYGDLKSYKISSLKRKECARLISYMPQTENSAWDFTVRDIILTGRYAYSKNGNYSSDDEAIVESVIQELELGALAERNVHSLSGGEFQKVRIARSLVQTPQFLILDEPAASLDFVYEPRLMELLRNIAKEKQIGMIISIHDINQAARFTDKMLLLPKNEESIFGTTEEVFTLENLNKTYGAEFICKETKSFQLLQ